MKTMKYAIGLMALLPYMLTAAISDVNPNSTAVTPGAWCGNFPAAKSYAESKGIPLVIVWGKKSCHQCEKLVSALSISDGLAWAAGKNAIFCFVEGYAWGDYDPNGGALDFVGGVSGDPDYLNQTPFVRFYWPAKSKSLRFEGCTSSDYSSLTDAALLKKFQDKYTDFIGTDIPESDPEIDPDPASSVFPFVFPFGNEPNDRLEIVTTRTAYVDIPLVRTNLLSNVVKCVLKCDYWAEGKTQSLNTWTKTVQWSAGETMKLNRYSMPFEDSKVKGYYSGDYVIVTLEDMDGKVMATRTLTYGGNIENSPKNPYWIGEKTKDTLAWGEWSMDLDIVTNKVKAFNAKKPAKKAYAMMLVGGSTWCPDCAMAEENFFSKQEFKDWAKQNQIVFGVLDIPNNPQAENAYPSQLRYESNRTSDSYVTLRGTMPADETMRYQSGAGYLSRHSVDYSQALAVAERNAFLMGHDTLNGGWNRPERANKNRTGVPVLLLLRDDGTIAARWNRFSDVGPSAYSAGYLKRFEEMLALVDEPQEEADDDKSTTRQTIADGETAAGSVSSIDQADVYEIVGAKSGDLVAFAITGGAAELSATIIDGATGTAVASASGFGNVGFEVAYTLEGASTYYLKIAPKAIADGTFFGYTNAASTVCPYSAKATVTSGGGTIGFVASVTNVTENCGEVLLSVCRQDGSLGRAQVTVKLLSSSGEDVASRIGWTDTTLVWQDRERGVKQVRLMVNSDAVINHNMTLGFGLSDLSGDEPDLELGTSAMTVNVYDDDVFGASIYKNVWFEKRIPIPIAGYQAGDTVTVSLKQGALPAGLSVTVDGGQVVVSGYADGMEGEKTAKLVVKVQRGGTTVSTQEMEFNGTVIDYDFRGVIPSLSETKTYGNVPCVVNNRVVGLLTVTVPADGSLSARYFTGGDSYGYSADGWASFDQKNGILVSELARTDDTSKKMRVTLDASSGKVVFADPKTTGVERVVDLPVNAWQDGALAWKGQYTVQLPQTNVVDELGSVRLTGSAYMTLKMTDAADIASGTMLYAGVLPNGRAVYGSAVLNALDDETAALAFYHVSDAKTSAFSFSGGLAIAKNAETKYKKERWSVSSAWTPFWSVSDGPVHMSEFGVYGGYYDKTEISARFNEDFAGALDNFAFVADTTGIVSGRYGAGTDLDPVCAEVMNDVPRISASDANPRQVELDFDPETGIVSGSFNFPFKKKTVALTYRGVALPGWQGCMTCSRGGDAVERPWAAGSCWFSDRDKNGVTYRNGCEVRLDRYQADSNDQVALQAAPMAASSAPVAQMASATVAAGKCQSEAQPLAAGDVTYSCALVREWNENLVQPGGGKGGWMDGGTSSADQWIGSAWLSVTMEKGKDYVITFECDEDMIIASFLKPYYKPGTDKDGNPVEVAVYPLTKLSCVESSGKTHYYVRASDWKTKVDPDTITYDFKVSGGKGAVGQTFKVTFRQVSIDDVIEYALGTIQSPIQLDVTEDGSTTIPEPAGYNGRWYTAYSAKLEADELYTFTGTPASRGVMITVPVDDFDQIPGDYDLDQDAGTFTVRVDTDYEITLLVMPNDAHWQEDVAGCTLAWQVGEVIPPEEPSKALWSRTYAGTLGDVDKNISAVFSILAQGMDNGTTNFTATVSVGNAASTYLDYGNSEEMYNEKTVGGKTFSSILSVTLLDETHAHVDGMMYLGTGKVDAYDFSGVLGEDAEPSDSFDDYDYKTQSAEDMGITADAFKDEPAGSAMLKKLRKWGADNGVTISDVNNGMRFTKTGDPDGVLAAAFLLDCAPTEEAVEAAKKQFVITSFDPAKGVIVSAVKADGDAYGNGCVEIRSSTTLDGSFDTTAKGSSAKLFYRAYLVKGK